jgi:hypothetical protein
MKRRAGTSIVLKGEARGFVILSPHELIEHMNNPRGLRTLSEALKPRAHDLAKRLLRVAADPQRSEGDPVPIPPYLLSEAVLILLALPRPQRGRPPKAETTLLLQFLVEGQPKRGAARAVAGKTGKPIENLRRRLRPKKPGKPKTKRRRGT